MKDKFYVTIEKDSFYWAEGSDPDYILSVTQNGAQWTTINFHSLEQLEIVQKEIEKYLKEKRKNGF